MKCIIVDIDGTLSDASHRLHFLEGEHKDWKGFYSAMNKDLVHADIAELVSLYFDKGYGIVMVTGRPLEYFDHTTEWLAKNNVQYHDLYMRAHKDYRQDYEVKLELIEEAKKNEWEPVLALEDRDQVVKAFREAGLRVLQVSAGSY